MQTRKILRRNRQGRRLLYALKCAAIATCIALLAGLIRTKQLIPEVAWYLLASAIQGSSLVLPFGDPELGPTERQRRWAIYATVSFMTGLAIVCLICIPRASEPHLRHALVMSQILWVSLPIVVSLLGVDLNRLYEAVWILPSAEEGVKAYLGDQKNPIILNHQETFELMRMIALGLVRGPCLTMPERIHIIRAIGNTAYSLTFERERSNTLAIQRYDPEYERVLTERAEAMFADATPSLPPPQPANEGVSCFSLVSAMFVLSALQTQVEMSSLDRSCGYNAEQASIWTGDVSVPRGEPVIELSTPVLITSGNPRNN